MERGARSIIFLFHRPIFQIGARSTFNTILVFVFVNNIQWGAPYETYGSIIQAKRITNKGEWLSMAGHDGRGILGQI